MKKTMIIFSLLILMFSLTSCKKNEKVLTIVEYSKEDININVYGNDNVYERYDFYNYNIMVPIPLVTRIKGTANINDVKIKKNINDTVTIRVYICINIEEYQDYERETIMLKVKLYNKKLGSSYKEMDEQICYFSYSDIRKHRWEKTISFRKLVEIDKYKIELEKI